MAMTITEADAVAKLTRFILSGELYTGQPESASAVAAQLVYLADRAEKVLQLNLPGDEQAYAARLEALAPQADRAASIEQMRYAEWCKGQAAEASAARLIGLKEIDQVHIEWGGTDLDDVNQLELWERIGRALRKAGV
ncbi:hypothetical protein ACFVJS_04030 [Nocardioides sp. NPDC057772]|uniref:hypothetical protein n=1 Tax=Nocardioides sp. NPDC057772 TaxID=3346245 RepID=UPI003671D3BE